jgi:hypothetical protein
MLEIEDTFALPSFSGSALSCFHHSNNRYHWQKDRACFLNSPGDPSKETSEPTEDSPSVTTADSPPDTTTDENDAEKNEWPVEEVYLVNNVCYDASNGIKDGKLFGSRQECCLAIVSRWYHKRINIISCLIQANQSSHESYPCCRPLLMQETSVFRTNKMWQSISHHLLILSQVLQ